MVRVPALLASAAVALLLLTGCAGAVVTPDTALPTPSDEVDGGEDAEEFEGALPLPDACSLVSLEELEQITGVVFAEGQHFTEGETEFQSICNYNPPEGFFPFVQILVNNTFTDLEAQRDAAIAGSPSGTATDVDVPGGEAGYTLENGTILAVGMDGYFVQVAFTDDQGSDQTAILIELAEAVGAAL